MTTAAPAPLRMAGVVGTAAMVSVSVWALVSIATAGFAPLLVVSFGLLLGAFLIALRSAALPVGRASWIGALALLGIVLQLVALRGQLRTLDAWGMDVVACITLVMIWRGRHVIGWTTMLGQTVIVWGTCGFEELQNIGSLATTLVIGVVAAGARALDWYRSRMDAYSATEREAIEWRIAQDAYQIDHQQRIERTGRLAGDMLQRIVDAGGILDRGDRAECRLLHQSIRDETRGRYLLSDGVRQQVLEHRRRGAVVQLLDDGELGRADPAALARVLDEIAVALFPLESDRIIIRSTTVEDGDLVTVTAVSVDPVAAALGQDDDERLDLRFERRLPRAVVAARAEA